MADSKEPSVSVNEPVLIVPENFSNKKLGHETLRLPSFSEDDQGSPRKRSLSMQASMAINNLRKQSVAVTLSFWASFRGLFYALLASAIFSVVGVLVKFTGDVDPSLIGFVRFIQMGVLAGASLASLPDQPILGSKDVRIWIVLRGISGATGMYLRYLTIQLLPLANAMVLILIAPVITTILARFFFKEPCGVFHAVALAIALIGISLTAKLDAFFGLEHEHDSTSQILGLFSGLGAALCQSTTALILRYLKRTHFAVIVFTCSWVACAENAVIAYFSGALYVPERGITVILIMLIGVLGYFGQISFTKALSLEETGIVVMAQCSMDLFLAFVLQIIIFQVIPDVCTVIGSLMVFSAVLLTSLRKYLVTLPEEHHLRYYLAFILK